MAGINNIHDKYFRSAMSNLRVAKDFMEQHLPLIDVNTIPDETLKQRVWSGVLTLMQKYIYERDLLKYFEAVLPLLRELMTNQEESYILSTIHYMIDAGSINDIERLIRLTHELSPEIGNEAMTLAERLRLEGRTVGKVEGRMEAGNEIAKNLLARGVDPSMVAQVTGLPFETISSITTEQ